MITPPTMIPIMNKPRVIVFQGWKFKNTFKALRFFSKSVSL